MKKIIICIVLLTSISLYSKAWVREYTYQASEADSKITSRSIALEQVKRLLLQEIGLYVHSTVLSGEFEASGEVKDLSAKQIEIISAGITETKIIEEKWNGEIYFIKAEITADETDVIKRLDNVISDKEMTKQLEDSRNRTEESLSEIKRLKQQLTQTQDENEKLKIQNKYNRNSNELTADDWFQKGRNANDLGDYNNAILYYQKAIEKDPNYDKAYYNLSVSYGKRGNYIKAIEFYQMAIIINPNLFPAYINMGNAYFLNGNYKKTKECYQKAIIINPNSAEAYYNLGVIYGEKEGNLKKAIEYFLKAIKINKDYDSAYFDLGRTYGKMVNYDKAIECFEKVIIINPEYEDVYYSMGVIYDAQNEYKKAIDYYKREIEINSNNSDAYYKMGIAYAYKKDYDKTIECLQQAARLGNNDAKDFLNDQGISW